MYALVYGVHDENEPNEHAPASGGASMLADLAREGARQMLAAALQAEVTAYIEQFADQVNGHGHRLVAGTARTLPARWPPQLALSAATITRLTAPARKTKRTRSASAACATSTTCMWVDGIHVRVRLEQAKVCLLVMGEVRVDGHKELIALADGSGNRRSRGRTCSATANTAACALPSWPPGMVPSGSGRPSVTCSPTPRSSGVGFHKLGNVLAALPKSAHPNAKKALAEIYNAEDKAHAETAARAFAAEYETKWPKTARSPTTSSRPTRPSTGPSADHELKALLVIWMLYVFSNRSVSPP